MLDFSIRYLHVLKTKLAGLNLTKILEADEFYNKQILDSINPYLQSAQFKSDVKKRGVVVDVGFGGGFPILPLAKLLPDIKFVGVESKRKKVDAVTLIAEELGLTNVTLVHSRLEDFLFDRPCTVTFKAVGTVKEYLPSIQCANRDMSVYFYKGPSFQELEGASLSSLEKHWKYVDNQKIDVPGTEERYLVSFQAQNVPRGTSKTLVKLSDYL
jgi:16S rRNA (guanine527-N7)-methyltransferase